MFQINNLIFNSEGKTILSLESQSIEANNHLLLLGDSGCGKTTLMNLLGGLMRPASGVISFEETSYSSLSETALDRLRAEHFGFVFQRLHLIGHLSVVQNIALAQQKPDQAKIKALISDLGLEGKEKQKARDLSVGEAQRVAIARAVANNPKVIFADEPTSALDDHNAERVMNLIFGMAQKTGATVIAATHDARIKDRFTSLLEMSA